MADGLVPMVSDHGLAQIELSGPGTPTVRPQWRHNPGLTEADRLRDFLAAVIRAARGEAT